MQNVSVIDLLGRLIVAMGVVLGVMLLAAKVVRARGLGGLSAAGGKSSRTRPVHIEVLARQGIGRNTSVAVVRMAGKALLLGVTEGSVTLLAEADPAALEMCDEDGSEANWTASTGGPRGPGPSWKAMIELARERTVRRR